METDYGLLKSDYGVKYKNSHISFFAVQWQERVRLRGKQYYRMIFKAGETEKDSHYSRDWKIEG